MQNQKRCNVCGEVIKHVSELNTEDYLLVKKEWGYFSNKDLTKHSFRVCESCYDKWIETFVIKIDEEETMELFKF